MLGRLCAIAAGAIFPPEIPKAAQRNSQGGWASSPNLPMSFQPCSSLNLGTERSVNTQGKGNPEGEFKGEGQKQPAKELSSIKMQKGVNICAKGKGAVVQAYQK